VLHVSEVTWGGVVSLIRDFTAEQVRRGHSVKLLAPQAFPALDEGIERALWGVDRRRPQTFARAVMQLRAAVREFRPDVIHLHSAYAGFLGRLRLSGTAGTPLVYQPHAWSFDAFEKPSLHRLAQRWELLGDRRTDVLVANCQDEIDEGRRIGVKTLSRSLGVPIDVEHFHTVPVADRARHRETLGLGEGCALLCLGRLAHQKGQDLLVAAWESAPVPNTILWLVGPGDPAPLQALAPTQWGVTVRWVGEQADVRPWIWASDLLVLPSRYETVAVVVAEAMACETPVVAVAVNGAAMAVTDGPHPPGGVVVEDGDVTRMLAEAERLLVHPATRKAMASAGRKRVTSLFTTSLVGDRLEQAYATAIKGQHD
jgi:glycosyltransferase involved in cell wall biosynthesis